MFYGSQTIQQQRRLIEVGSQEGIITGEHGKGQIGKVGKNRSRKLPSICKHCGVEFYGIYGEKNEYCSSSCHNEFRVMKWLPCSVCMAAIGFGSQTSGRLLRRSDSSIRKQWKKRGIVSNRPKSGSISVEIRKQIAIKEFKTRKCNWEKIYAQSRMEDIRSHSSFPDWSYEWQKEKINALNMNSYYSAESQYTKACNRDILRHNFKSIYPDWSSLWSKSRMSFAPQRKAKDNLRTRLKGLMKTAKRGGANVRSSFIGCSTAQLARHLESGFTKRMSWDNYGSYWHVDHILPCASFDHTDQRQVAQCWHWTNLRALEAKQNLDKSNTITDPQMQLLLCATH